MVNQPSSLDLDPTHKSCIGGRTVITCRSCAGNAPRTSVCTACSGRGFTIFVCAHCNPAAAVNRQTAGLSASSTPGTLSRSSSTSVGSYANPSLRRDGGSGGGRVENTPRSHK